MKNVRFMKNRAINLIKYPFNWIRCHGTPGMKAKFAATTKDPVKLATLAFSKELAVVGAVAGNIFATEATLENFIHYDLFRKYFEYSEYENTVLIPLAGNKAAHAFTIGELSKNPRLYEVVANNPRVIKIVDSAIQSDSSAFLAVLSSCTILHVRQAIKQNKHTPDFIRKRLSEESNNSI